MALGLPRSLDEIRDLAAGDSCGSVEVRPLMMNEDLGVAVIEIHPEQV